ncbi:MAG: ABC transporter permease [Actinobacteria bacterium]|nr:MAG: ABC transporter permease [Actinomycetota bacterium]
MIRVALRGLAGRKLRASLTAFAIVLGVAMVSGTFVLTDTMNGAFDSIISQSYKNADVVVSGKTAFDTDTNGNAVQAPSFPETLLPKVRALPDVKAAAGSLTDNKTKLVGRDGKLVGGHGAPNLAFSVEPRSDQRFNPLVLTSGRWPSGAKEVAIDSGTAGNKHYKVGDTIGIQTRGPVQQFRVVGVVKLPGVSIGGATMSVFDIPTAQMLFHRQGRLDVIRVQAKSGVPTPKLLSEVRAILPSTVQARDVAAQEKRDKKTVNFTSFIQYFLLAFAGIALFVGSFVIANTLSITIAQRVREFATLRTLGATRRQILRAVVIEALVIGTLGSVTGLFLVLGLAKGLNALFKVLGFDLPTAATVFKERTVIVSLLVGIVITLLASLRPALRATRVPPIAAVREGAILPPGRFARLTPILSLITLVLGVLLLGYGVLGHGLSTANRLGSLGFGIVLLFFGVSANASRLVRPLASVLGWPATRIGGTAGVLARDNTMRNTKRTASTASALMIGLALVTFVAILGQGIRSSFESAVDDLLRSDYALTSTDTFTPLSVSDERALAKAPNVTAISGVRAGSARILGKTDNLTGVAPNMAQVIHLRWKQGSAAVPSQLGSDGAFVDHKYAKKNHLTIGSPINIETPSRDRFTVLVKGIFKLPNGGSPFGPVTISNANFDAHYPSPENEMVFVKVRGGVTDANTATLEHQVKGFADAKVQTASQFKTNFEKPLNKILILLYVLLLLSVIVSLFGIVNTLVLTVFERTREIGMLRAVGMTRRQTRSMIRHESVVTSLIGGALGMAVGFFLALLVTHALSSEGIVFAVPWLTLLGFVLATVVVGVIAAIFPARRAAGLNVLAALQYE